MSYIRLTNDCKFFNADADGNKLYLTWNMPMDLSPYKYISLREIQIGPLSVKRHDYVLDIYSNIIARTLYNPLRELATVRVSKNSSFIDSPVSPGMFRKQTNFIYFDESLCLISIVCLRN